LKESRLDSLLLLKEMVKKLDYLATGVTGDQSLFYDLVYYFLRMKGIRHVYFSSKLGYIIASNVSENDVKQEDLKRVLKLFNYQFVVYPFYAGKEITFSDWEGIFHIHEHKPEVIVAPDENKSFELFKAFKLFIYYLFLFTIFQKIRKNGLYNFKFKSFYEVHMEFNGSHCKFENILLSLSKLYPFISFFATASNRLRIYKAGHITEIDNGSDQPVPLLKATF
jgi:hypothetical protein